MYFLWQSIELEWETNCWTAAGDKVGHCAATNNSSNDKDARQLGSCAAQAEMIWLAGNEGSGRARDVAGTPG